MRQHHESGTYVMRPTPIDREIADAMTGELPVPGTASCLSRRTVIAASNRGARESQIVNYLWLGAHSDEVGRGFRAKPAACTD